MDSKPQYIEVAVPVPVFNTFTYKIDNNLTDIVSVGKRVLVPFGQRIITGYILGPSKKETRKNIKLILDILDDKPLFPDSMLPFLRWIADYYIYPIGEVIKHALPGGLNIYDSALLRITEKGRLVLLNNSITPIENIILNQLEKAPFSCKDLEKKLNINVPRFLISKIEKHGWIIKKRVIKGGTTKPKFERYIKLAENQSATNEGSSRTKKSATREKIIDVLKIRGSLSVKELKETVSFAPATVKSMEKDGDVIIFKKSIYRDPFGEKIQDDIHFELTDEQNKVVSTVMDFYGKGYAAFLLAGVTGSGKTEVYMRLAEEILKNSLSVLILVPEIALISQTEQRFRARFKNKIALLHSGLTPGEKYDQWLRIINGDVKIVIGARSAIFAPFTNLGLIIVDEEHDTSYKQNGSLNYNARDLAIVRAKLNNCIALLGSATPSIQSYYNTTTNKYFKTTLTKRVEQRQLPEIIIVDLRNNKDVKGAKRFISQKLYNEMEKTLEHGKQVLLFLNQRGFASHPVCAACGEPLKCRDCSITLTLHNKENVYKCHYCGFSSPATAHCSVCGSKSIKLLGMGTEKVEAAVKALFPKAKVARMDHDTTIRKGSIFKILKGLKNRTTDILIGTQMVAKGHDFPHITLVGIICADTSLNFPDFRAGERTFQLIAQVAGRAGRGNTSGKVILQTYNPDHFSILTASNQDYDTFYKQEIEFRKMLNYPPFSRMIQLKISGKDKNKTRQHAFYIGKACNELEKKEPFKKQMEVLGPIESPVYMIAKKYRWQILLKGLSVKSLNQFIKQLLFKNRSKFDAKDVKIIIDVDPFFMM